MNDVTVTDKETQTKISSHDDIFGLDDDVVSLPKVQTIEGKQRISIIRVRNRDINVCAYCRVSTDKKDQFNSFSAQKDFFESAFVMRKNWKMKTIFADQGISGTSLRRRDEFNRMIAEAKKGMYELILCKSVSRFSRNISDLLNIIEDLRKVNVFVWFMTEDICTDLPEYREMLIKEGEAAEAESRNTSKRVRWGQKFAMQQGTVFGRLEMYGYNIKRDENGSQFFEIIPEEAEVVRRIFTMYANGMGSFKIARQLEAEGVKTKRFKNGWSGSVIIKILKNYKYAGMLLQGLTYTENYLTHKKKNNNGEAPKYLDKEHHLESAIVSMELWNAVQKRLAANALSDEVRQKHSNRYWCSGKIFCGECGQRYVSHIRATKGGSEHKAWKCWENQQHGRKKDLMRNGSIVIDEATGEVVKVGCDNHGVNDKVLKQGIYDIITQLLRPQMNANYEKIRQVIICQQKKCCDQISIESLQNKLTDLESEYISLTRQLNNMAIKEKAYKLTSAQIEKEMQQINDQLAELNRQKNENETMSSELTQRLDKLKEIIELKDDNISEDLYRSIVERIEVYQDHILKYYIFGWNDPITLQYTTKGRMENYTVVFKVIST